MFELLSPLHTGMFINAHIAKYLYVCAPSLSLFSLLVSFVSSFLPSSFINSYLPLLFYALSFFLSFFLLSLVDFSLLSLSHLSMDLSIHLCVSVLVSL